MEDVVTYRSSQLTASPEPTGAACGAATAAGGFARADAPRHPALKVECAPARDLAAHATAWADLCARALEPNVFLDPAFLLPLLQHVAAARRPDILLVWEENGPVSFGRLVGLVALRYGRLPLRIGRAARGFAHEQMASGVPLLDRERADEVLEAVLAWLGTPAAGRRPALALDDVPLQGPFWSALQAACRRGDRPCRVVEARARAVLHRPDGSKDGGLLPLASARRRKEYARQRRRLSEAGRRLYASARTPETVAAATERFLALEHRGWKGRRGTSLLAGASLATFTRTMTRLLAERGACRIDAIEIDGHPVAMGIVLRAGDRAFFWKTCFDEAFASLSPGVQLARELTQAQLAEPDVATTDSCAIADHPMIDRLWRAKAQVGDVVVATRSGGGPGFALALAGRHAMRRARAAAKALRQRLRRRGD